MIDGSESMLRLWDAKTFEEVASLEGHTMAIWRTAFSPDGITMASCSSDRTLRIWSLPQIIKGRFEISGHSRRIASLKISTNSQRMVSSDVGGDVWTWDTLTGQILSKLPLARGSTYQVAISGDGSVVATFREKESLILWSADTGKNLFSIIFPEGNIHTLALSFKGEYLACQGDKNLWVISGQSSKGGPQYRLPVNSSITLEFNQNNKLLASSSASGEIEVWDWRQQKLVNKLVVGEKKEIRALAFSPDHQFLASGAEDDIVRVWSLTSNEMIVLSGHKRWIRSICYSPDSRWLVSGSWDNCILVWDMNDNQPKASFFTQDSVVGIAFKHESYDLIAVDLARRPNIYKLRIMAPE
jgi:WD40 repeat protein